MRRPVPFLAAAAAAFLLGACGEARIRKLDIGISKDSALQIMGGDPERVDAYFTQGQLLEALYFAPPGADSGTTPERELTPVVVVNDTVTAWGWSDWEAVASKYGIVLKK